MALLRDWHDLVRTDFPKIGPITPKTIADIEKEKHRFRGGFRISTGRFWTDDDFDNRRRKVLSTDLP